MNGFQIDFFAKGWLPLIIPSYLKKKWQSRKKPLKAALPCSWRKVQLCFYFTLALFIWDIAAKYCRWFSSDVRDGQTMLMVFIWDPGKILQVVFSHISRLRNVCKNTSIKIEATKKSKKQNSSFHQYYTFGISTTQYERKIHLMAIKCKKKMSKKAAKIFWEYYYGSLWAMAGHWWHQNSSFNWV